MDAGGFLFPEVPGIGFLGGALLMLARAADLTVLDLAMVGVLAVLELAVTGGPVVLELAMAGGRAVLELVCAILFFWLVLKGGGSSKNLTCFGMAGL